MWTAMVLGCENNESPIGWHGNPGHDEDGHVEFVGPELDTYVTGLEKTGDNGHFVVQLIDSDPIPKDLTLYDWRVVVLDLHGDPVDGAFVEAEPRMPAHDHGTHPEFTAATAGDEPGTYDLLDLNLFMAGVWEVTIRVEEGGMSDEVSYAFDLDG